VDTQTAPIASLSTSRLSAWLDPHPSLNGLSMIDHLFKRLQGLYAHKWMSAFPDAKSIKNWRDVWAEAFVDEEITLAEIKAGLTACLTKFSWPPSLPEFLSVCRPDSKPQSPEVLFHRAVREMEKRRAFKEQDWPSRGVFWAAAALGDDLLNVPYKALAARWEALLMEFDKGSVDIPMVDKSRALPAKTAAESRSDAKEKIRVLKDLLTRNPHLTSRKVAKIPIADTIRHKGDI